MRAGRLKNRVQLQSFAETKSSSGFPTRTWSTVATVWAATEAVRGNEAESANELVATQTTNIILRYDSSLSTLNSTWRVKFGTRIFSIISVINPDDRSRPNAVIEMLCVEGKKDGG